MNEIIQTRQMQEPRKQEPRLLVLVQPGQISEELVRWTHRSSRTLNCPWCAVYVDTSSPLREADQLALSRALALARTLGAEVITTSGADFVAGLLRIASQRQITQIIIGKPSEPLFRRLFRNDRWLERLLQESGDIDIHLLRFKEEPSGKAAPFKAQPYGSTLREYLTAVGIIVTATWALTFTRGLITFQAAAWMLITVVVVMAAYVGRGATLLATILSALLWDFFFEPPLYSFNIASGDDQLLFGLYIVISLVLGQLTVRIRRQEMEERERQERAEALQALTREVTEATGFDDMLARSARQTSTVFKAPIALLLPSSSGQLNSHPAGTFTVPEQEIPTAGWACENGQAAGKFTANFPMASALYLPLAASGAKMGVIGLQLSQPAAPTVHQRNLLDAFAEQIALAINRYHVQEISEKAKLLTESERLSKTLLNSISHEIRTPLAIIQTATAYMLDFERRGFSDSQRKMLAEIQEATDRLNRLVGKVLEITRLESGHVKPIFKASEVSELVEMAEGETRKELARHQLTIDLAPDLPPVAMDFELMLHSLTNLMSNAAFHTPEGTKVRVEANVEDGTLRLIVADEGPGIPPESMPHLFEKFYRAPNARTGGTGLGLSLVKGFVEAHGGRVTAENRTAGGAAFTIRLPLNQSLAEAG